MPSSLLYLAILVLAAGVTALVFETREMAARLGCATGLALAEAGRRYYPRRTTRTSTSLRRFHGDVNGSL